MGNQPVNFPFKVGDRVAYKRDIWRKGVITKVSPSSNEVEVRWKIKSSTVATHKLMLVRNE